jgi:ribosomal protein L9
MKKEFTIEYLKQRISTLEDRYARFFIQNRRKHLFIVKGTLDNYKQLLKQLMEEENRKLNAKANANRNIEENENRHVNDEVKENRKINEDVNKRSLAPVSASGNRTLTT